AAHRESRVSILLPQPVVGAPGGPNDVVRDLAGRVAALGAPRATRPPVASTSEQVTKQIAEPGDSAAKQIFEVLRLTLPETHATRCRAPVSASCIGIEALAQPVLSELVVQLALLGVAQDLVGAVDRLEPGFGSLVPRVLVRMQLRREASVSLLDFFRRSIALHP